MQENELTSVNYWNDMWHDQALQLHPSFSVNTRSVQRILRQEIRPGMKVLELGCAPGKYLAWVAKYLQADVTGIDYSEIGIGHATRLFQYLNLAGELKNEDLFKTSVKKGQFDVVYSLGLIEHFNDARDITRLHLEFLKANGVAVIVIPNWGPGIYGRMQKYFAPESLEVHNVTLMCKEALLNLTPKDLTSDAKAFATGRFSLGSVYFERRWPLFLSRLIKYASYGLGTLQPFDIESLCPLYVLRMRRSSAGV